MIIISTETGGADRKRCALISVGAVHAETGAAFYGIVKPQSGLRYEAEAESVHGLTIESLEEHGLEEGEVLWQLSLWLDQFENPEWGGMDCSRHREFLEEAFGRQRLAVPEVLDGKPIDVLSLVWMAHKQGKISLLCWPKTGRVNYSLAGIAEALGLPKQTVSSRNAVEDAALVARIYRTVIAEFAVTREVVS
jgi:DNA polymerase III epsilon subunit-like protein